MLANPARAIHEATGAVVPDGFQIRVVDQSAADLTVVLPLTSSDDELTTAELEGWRAENFRPPRMA